MTPENIILHEVCSQPYANMVISAGAVEGDPIDDTYLKLEREGEEPTLLLLRKDEALAAAWVLVGAAWSAEIGKLVEADEAQLIEKKK